METQKDLEEKVREILLLERLETCHKMIGEMCKELRPPKMSVPVRFQDEDFFIGTTLNDCKIELTQTLKEFGKYFT